MTGSVLVQEVPAEAVRRLASPIFSLYRETFSLPPYKWPEGEDDVFPKRFLRLTEDPTFAIVTAIAIAIAGDSLVGFAYGRTLPATTHWWDGFTTPVDPAITTEREGRTFALIDFAVAAPYRGRGVGRRLHDTLLSSRTEERATLAMDPNAAEALAVYRHWGWTVVGRLRGPATDFAPELDILIRPLQQPE